MKGADSTAFATLITIPLSHYCEKARWALDRAGLAYREQAHAPLIHRLLMRGKEGGTVPVLVRGGRRYLDSTDILLLADEACGGGVLYPSDEPARAQVQSLEELFDRELGPHSRRWAYEQLLRDTKLLRRLWSSRIPKFEASLVPLMVPIVRRLVRKAYRITPESAARSLGRVRAVFTEVDMRLGDGRRFLVGERFSAADLTFAALAAPMLFPSGCRAVYPTLEEAPSPMRQEALHLRNSPAGRFVLRLYLEERERRGGPAPNPGSP